MKFLIGFLGVLIALVGWFGFESLALLVLGTVFYIIETIIEWKYLNAGAKVVDVIIFGIGCAVALVLKTPFYVGGMIAINCYSAIVVLMGLFIFIKYGK